MPIPAGTRPPAFCAGPASAMLSAEPERWPADRRRSGRDQDGQGGERGTMKPTSATIQIDEAGPQNFTLAVTFDGRRFECGSYLSRAAAMQAGRLFVQRKEGEAAGRQRGKRGGG